jgi:hypothetical protein
MLIETYCIVDDFCKSNSKEINGIRLSAEGRKCRRRDGDMTLSEQVTLLIVFHCFGFRNFKTFYTQYVTTYLKPYFPRQISYSRFVRRMPQTLCALVALMVHLQGKSTGISFVDSTSIKVCHNRRINRNKVFAGTAARGKTTMGWFFGFKLHFIVNDKGEILSFAITKGNASDGAQLPALAKRIFGKLFGDKGYISKKLSETLKGQGVTLITSLKSNMKNKLMPIIDKILLRKRFIIETINDLLKNEMQIEHTRHRSRMNFLVNLIAGLVAYAIRPAKPSLNLPKQADLLLLA